MSDSDYPGNAADAPRLLPSPGEGVELWWCPLVADDEALRRLATWLSAEERARAARFGKPVLAQRYTVGRGALRYVLAEKLGVGPAEVAIERDPRGRPHLAHASTIDFNVSHTGDAAMFGLVDRPGVRIGVDLERASRTVDALGLARKVCTPRERELLAALDAEARRLAFLRLWTCKEAMCKATGDGFAAPFDQIDVDVGSHRPLAPMAGPPPYHAGAWTLLDAGVCGDYLGTIALWSTATRANGGP